MKPAMTTLAPSKSLESLAARRTRRRQCRLSIRLVLATLVFTVDRRARPRRTSPFVVASSSSNRALVPSHLEAPPQSHYDDDPEEELWRSALPSPLRNDKGAPIHRCVVESSSLQDGASRRCTVYLLGTSHISRTSCDDARLLMEHIRPDVLFVELCSQRAGILLPPSTPTPPADKGSAKCSEPKKRSDRGRRRTETGGESNGMSRMSSVLLAKIQSDYAAKLNVTIGGEFREAFRAALGQQRSFWKSRHQKYETFPASYNNHPIHAMYNALDGREHSIKKSLSSAAEATAVSVAHPRGERPCTVILGDRPLRLTLLRAWESLRLWGRIRLVLGLIWSSVWQPSDEELIKWMNSILNDRTGTSDVLTKALDELGRTFPALRRAVIDERDEYMAAKLMQTAALLINLPSRDGGDDDDDDADATKRGEKVIVAVVGTGHCQGIYDRLKKRRRRINLGDEKVHRNAQGVGDKESFVNANFWASPEEEALATLVETKKWKIEESPDVRSLVTDVVQFDYESALISWSNPV